MAHKTSKADIIMLVDIETTIKEVTYLKLIYRLLRMNKSTDTMQNV